MPVWMCGVFTVDESRKAGPYSQPDKQGVCAGDAGSGMGWYCPLGEHGMCTRDEEEDVDNKEREWVNVFHSTLQWLFKLSAVKQNSMVLSTG